MLKAFDALMNAMAIACLIIFIIIMIGTRFFHGI